MSETLDPKTSGFDVPANASALLIVAQIVFHSDLRRIGELAVLGAAGRDGTPVIIGRDSPTFSPLSGGSPRPLADPCVSRQQFTIRFDARCARFVLHPAADARRPLRLFGIDGAPVEERLESVEAGTLVAIGDRILLWIGLASVDPGLSMGGLVGTSEPMVAMRRQIRALASAPSTVLVRGETGVGKELVARALHTEGDRRAHPFVPVNCAALPHHLVESELFGHTRGAFSGADRAAEGLLRAAKGGTVFLDEIGELHLDVQAKLLRVLQERTVRPLGESRESPIEARIVAATNRDLAEEVRRGRFREDLFARLESPSILLPPLRARRIDIPLLFRHFLERASTSSRERGPSPLVRDVDARSPRVPLEFMLALLGHDWPRNVRELEKYTFGAALSSAEAGRFSAPTLAALVAPSSASRATAKAETPETQGRPTSEEVLRQLDVHAYVQKRAAAAFGVSHTTLDRWLKAMHIRQPRDLTREEIEDAQSGGGAPTDVAARLRVSLRGLKLRMTELGMKDDARRR